jgi:hypothetical protein
MKTKNSIKKSGATVWHKNELKVITSQNVGKEYVILEDAIKLKKSSVILAKIGDSVEFKDLEVLPTRCEKMIDMKITYFNSNGCIGTDKDLNQVNDSSHYSHFRKPFV